MGMIKTLIGRRQFLIAAGIASTCALTCKKLTGFETPGAMAAEQAATNAVKAAGNRCPHLLSPLRIRNKVLKNRIMHTISAPFFMQGPENFPTEMYRKHYSDLAKNAAIITMSTHYGSTTQRTYKKMDLKSDFAFNHYTDSSWDDIPLVYNYISEMIDNIHYQGSLILFGGNSGGMMGDMSAMFGGAAGGQGGTSGEAAGGMPGGMGGMPGGMGGMPGGAAGGMGGMPAGIPGFASMTDEEALADAKDYEQKGYDVYQLNTSNIKAAKEIRAATNLVLMGAIRGAGGMMFGGGLESSQPTEAELKDAVEQARQLEGAVDILWIRIDQHPNDWTQDKGRPKSLAYAEAIKKAGIKIITCPSAGFHDPVENDAFIASGKTDMVGMTMPLFADQELVRKVKEGRADDVVPCLGCHNCHGISMSKPPWYSTCTVNPKWGLPPYQLQSITKPMISKKVAVIGGGPGGMKAALVAAERGHKVTLYEKDSSLGGLLRISDNSQWRWSYKNLKEWFILQVKKAGVDIKLNTTATPDLIKAGKYDTVMVATGSDIVASKMKTDGSKVFNILEAYSKKGELGKNVVVVGGGKFGMEVAAGMIRDGHNVTILTSGEELVAAEDRGPHNVANQEKVLNNPAYSCVLEANVKSITGGKVVYTDSKGSEKSVQADSIVVWSGVKPRMDEAEKFIGSADEVLILGDCSGSCGTIQKTIRSAFFVASQV